MDIEEDLPLCRFGTPLEPLAEEDVPSKKPIPIEDQIVTDENGKRRFHGAFTGGFSAGFWNTVGSLEGWKPQSFKSTRSEKAESRKRKLPTDFMDEEDLREFGIAPQRVQAREDFAKNDASSKNKRKLFNKDTGPIPGIPVLQQLLEPARDKIAVRLLKNMGWKPGQGVGPRQTRREKKQSNMRNDREKYVMKMYGCDIFERENASKNDPTEGLDISEEEDDEITFAPDDFEPVTYSFKHNTFGFGYRGLSAQLNFAGNSHVNLFDPLEIIGTSNKKLSISGQAFGVGALEVEDEDIYAKDDMSKYDFSLGSKKKTQKQKPLGVQDVSVLEGFTQAGRSFRVQKKVYDVCPSSSFQPRNWSQRRTRFEPLPEEKLAVIKQSEEYKRRGLGRRDLQSDDRGKILEGQTDKSSHKKSQNVDAKSASYLQYVSNKYKERKPRSKQILEAISSNFVQGGLITNKNNEANNDENQSIMSKAKDITKKLGGSSETFKPFINNESKQLRYEKFIEANLKDEKEIKTFLATLQPIHLSEWDREMELKEFVQARNIYKPLVGLMSERFVAKSGLQQEKEISQRECTDKIQVVVKRTKKLWKPCTILCKRFNIPEPFNGVEIEAKIPKKNKFSVFDYIEHSVNTKKDFVTPVIIPKHVEKAKSLKQQNENLSQPSQSTDDHVSALTFKDEVTQFVDKSLKLNPSVIGKKVKSDLELKIEENKNKHPSEKKDIFKSIFESTSDDEEMENDNNIDEPKTYSDSVISALIKPSAPVNILRSNSPPRGIFAALFSKSAIKEAADDKASSAKMEPITFKPKHQRQIEDDNVELDNMYGPKVPTNLAAQNQATKVDFDRKIDELLSVKHVQSVKNHEEWIEKSGSSRKKSKDDKKSKDKSKHKKSKHKRKKNK